MDSIGAGRGLAFGAGDPAFGLLDAGASAYCSAGRPWQTCVPSTARTSSSRPTARRFSGSSLSAKTRGRSSGQFKLAPSPTAPADLHAADITSLRVTGWENTTEPKLGGKALPLEQYETAFSLAIAPDATSLILGAHFALRRFDKGGKQLWQKPVPGVAWGVNLAREGRLILAAYGDGTIRWHRAADGEELLALFIHVPDDPKADKRGCCGLPRATTRRRPAPRT